MAGVGAVITEGDADDCNAPPPAADDLGVDSGVGIELPRCATRGAAKSHVPPASTTAASATKTTNECFIRINFSYSMQGEGLRAVEVQAVVAGSGIAIGTSSEVGLCSANDPSGRVSSNRNARSAACKVADKDWLAGLFIRHDS